MRTLEQASSTVAVNDVTLNSASLFQWRSSSGRVVECPDGTLCPDTFSCCPLPEPDPDTGAEYGCCQHADVSGVSATVCNCVNALSAVSLAAAVTQARTAVTTVAGSVLRGPRHVLSR